jgi:hypothetical protein
MLVAPVPDPPVVQTLVFPAKFDVTVFVIANRAWSIDAAAAKVNVTAALVCVP